MIKKMLTCPAADYESENGLCINGGEYLIWGLYCIRPTLKYIILRHRCIVGGDTKRNPMFLENEVAEIKYSTCSRAAFSFAMMMKWEWENFVANVNRFIELHRKSKPANRLWLILSTLFLLLLIRIVSLTAASERKSLQLPFFGPLSVLSSGKTLFSPLRPENLDEPAIKGTSIVGREAVEKFRNHLDCFSDSGKWVYDPTPRHIPWNYVGDTYVNVCEERHYELAKSSGYDHVFGNLADNIAMGNAAGNWSVREELKWVWQTNSSCPWRSISRDQFCRKIGLKGHVMVVGDSINHEIHWSLMNALITNGSGYRPLNGTFRVAIGPYEMCSDIFGNGRGFNVSFICNVFLTTVSDLHDPDSILYPWIDLLDAYQTKILLLNRGAHYEDDETVANGLTNVFTILARRYPHIHVIYRNTPPGHLDCMKFKEPLVSPQPGIKLPAKFHWGDFNRQNQLAKKIVEEFEYTYMDVYTMLALRPEAHISKRDCLHYCLPGPPDIATEYLYNILLLL